MLDRTPGYTIQSNKKINGLIPLHKVLVESFPTFKKELLKVLLQKGKIGNTLREVRQSIDEILAYDVSYEESRAPFDYIWKIEDVIRELSRNNDLFYQDLPVGWEEYLKNSVEEIISCMKNKPFLQNIFQKAIECIKAGEKVNFSEIYKSSPEKPTYKYEIAKILALLSKKYNIDFLSIGGSGSILKIGSKIEKNDVKENQAEIQRCLERLLDYNALALNEVIGSFIDFFKEVILKRHLNEFQQHEFVVYCLDKNPHLDIELVRVLTKKIFKNLSEQGISIRSKEKITFEVKFNQLVNDFYHGKYFPDLEKYKTLNHSFEEAFKALAQKALPKNNPAILALKNEFRELQKKGKFFVLAKYLELFPEGEEKRLFFNRILIQLIQAGIIGRKGRERYYICNPESQTRDDQSQILSVSQWGQKLEIQGYLDTFSTKILYYIFRDLKEVGFLWESIKAEDLKLRIEGDEIYLIFQNEKFKKYHNHIDFICNEVGDKKGVFIHIVWNNNGKN